MELLHSFFYGYFNLYLNLGLWCGMVMGIILLLRPVLCRLLTPGQRVVLWGVGWIGGFAPQLLSPPTPRWKAAHRTTVLLSSRGSS